MIENELTEDPIIHNFLQQYTETSWNQVLRVIAIHGIQSLNISPEKQSYTLEELEKLIEPQLTTEELEKQEPKEETPQKEDKEMNDIDVVKENENESQNAEKMEQTIEHVEQNNDIINSKQQQQQLPQQHSPQQQQTKAFISNYKNIVKSFPDYKTNNSNYSFQNQYSTKYMYRKKEGINCRHQRNQNECISCKTNNILGRNRFNTPSQISSPQLNFNYSNKY